MPDLYYRNNYCYDEIIYWQKCHIGALHKRFLKIMAFNSNNKFMFL